MRLKSGQDNLHTLICVLWCSRYFQRITFKNIFDFTTAGDWDFVAVVDRLHALYYSVDLIFLSFGIMCFIVEL